MSSNLKIVLPNIDKNRYIIDLRYPRQTFLNYFTYYNIEYKDEGTIFKNCQLIQPIDTVSAGTYFDSIHVELTFLGWQNNNLSMEHGDGTPI